MLLHGLGWSGQVVTVPDFPQWPDPGHPRACSGSTVQPAPRGVCRTADSRVPLAPGVGFTVPFTRLLRTGYQSAQQRLFYSEGRRNPRSVGTLFGDLLRWKCQARMDRMIRMTRRSLPPRAILTTKHPCLERDASWLSRSLRSRQKNVNPSMSWYSGPRAGREPGMVRLAGACGCYDQTCLLARCGERAGLFPPPWSEHHD
jgi:hypothetical protein